MVIMKMRVVLIFNDNNNVNDKKDKEDYDQDETYKGT